MAIVPADIEYRYTGGASNSDPDLSLGGTGSSVVFAGTIHALFDAVPSSEAVSGTPDNYRAIDIVNTHATLNLTDTFIWLSADGTGANDDVSIGLDATGTQTLADETTAPSAPAVTFTAPTTKASGVSLGTLAAGGGSARIFIKWNIDAGAPLATSSITLSVEGDTEE